MLLWWSLLMLWRVLGLGRDLYNFTLGAGVAGAEVFDCHYLSVVMFCIKGHVPLRACIGPRVRGRIYPKQRGAWPRRCRRILPRQRSRPSSFGNFLLLGLALRDAERRAANNTRE